MRYSRLLAIALMVTGLGWAQADAAPYHGDWHRHEEQRRRDRDCERPVVSIQNQARYFGSEDYFQTHGGTPRDYVIALYNDVLGRAPTSAEMDRWVSRWSSSGDGVTMSREFLIYAQSELNARPCLYR